jgi:hypothetical protein
MEDAEVEETLPPFERIGVALRELLEERGSACELSELEGLVCFRPDRGSIPLRCAEPYMGTGREKNEDDQG